MAGAILKKHHENKLWERMLSSPDDGVALKALIYLSDRAYGKAPQPITGSDGGAINIVFRNDAIPRPQRD